MSKLKEASNRARGLLHSILTSEKGNDLRPVRAARRALSLANDLAGRPLRPTEEIQRREQEIADAAAELERARGGHAKSRREAAPVVVYTTDQDHRTPQKIADILRGREVPFQARDVTDDEATRSWALTQAQRTGATEFPLIFIAGEPVGGLHELMQLDVRGDLVKKVFT